MIVCTNGFQIEIKEKSIRFFYQFYRCLYEKFSQEKQYFSYWSSKSEFSIYMYSHLTFPHHFTLLQTLQNRPTSSHLTPLSTKFQNTQQHTPPLPHTQLDYITPLQLPLNQFNPPYTPPDLPHQSTWDSPSVQGTGVKMIIQVSSLYEYSHTSVVQINM